MPRPSSPHASDLRSNRRRTPPQIAIACHILFAADDPLIDASVFDQVDVPVNVQVYHTERGGHLGFLGIPGTRGGFRWMDTQLLQWITDR